MDFSQALLKKSDAITEAWVSALRQDEQIEVTEELTYTATRNSLPRVLAALATVLSKSTDSDLKSLVDASLEHGRLRADQGFEPVEIAREYRLLRSIIFSELEPDLLRGSAADTLRAVRLIDTVIDEAIARCFDSYTDGRLSELRQLQSQLALTNQELTRLVRASKENLSQLAHELKTPLTSIIGYADLFLRQQRQPPEASNSSANLDSIEKVLHSGRLLLRLINDALEISRYDAGKMHPQLVPIDVRRVINIVLEMVAPLAESKSLSLTLDCDRAPNKAVTDPLRLQQVITNLLSNAIRYTECGSIHVECFTLPEQQWGITITDSGVGISPEDQANIFEPYFRANEQLSQNSEGTGLGLSIVSRLVKLLQGEIKMSSQPGFGSSFTILLPIMPDQN
ncbi:MAG TPA: sensor histidine kinase [Leptolyngbyaceae cyanobacterium]